MPSSDFGTRLEQLNEELHARHGARLGEAESVGAAGAGLLEQPQLDELNTRWAGQDGVARPRRRRYLWAALVALLFAVFAYLLLGWQWSGQAEAIRQHLAATPGLAVSSFDADKRGRLRVEALMDPLATDPRAWIAEHHPDVEIEMRTRPFVSLEARLVGRRVAQMLGLPEATVKAPDAQGVIHLSGSVPFADWYRARATPLSTPGVTRIEYDGLSYPAKPEIDAAIASIEAQSIAFASGTVTPEPGWQDVLADLGRKLQALERTGATFRIAFHLRTAGVTDEPGTLDQNRGLRQQRAEWLATRLSALLHAPSTIAVNPDAAFALPQSERLRAAVVTVQPYPAPVTP